MTRLISSTFTPLALSISLISVNLLSACSPAMTQPESEPKIATPPVAETRALQETAAAPTGQRIVDYQLNEDLLYQLLAGEFAGVRGDYETSVKHYAKAAGETEDPRVAERAAHVAIYAQQYEKALAATERWQALGGEADNINRVQALVYVRLEDLPGSLKALDKLLLINGKIDDRAVVALSHILQKEASPKFSVLLLEQLNQRHPDEISLLLLLGRFQANAGDYSEALESVDRVIALQIDNADAYLVKAQVLGGLGDQTAAVEAIAQAVHYRPEDQRLRGQYARMLVQIKDYDRAWDQYMELHQLTPDNNHVLLSLALLSIETGKSQLAMQYLNELVDRGFQQSQAYYYMGRIQQSEGELDGAIESYRQVMSGDLLFDARIREASILAHQGQVDEALHELELLGRSGEAKDQVRVVLAQGELLRQEKRHAEAMDIYNQALKRWPGDVDILYARALTAEKLDMLDQTEADLREVLRQEPENANALNALGYTLADRTDRLEEARGYIQRAAELLPDDPAILDSLGWVYYRLGDLPKAVEWLRKAFDKLEDAEIAAHLGEVLWQSGQQDEAEKIWQRGLKVEADHPILLDTLQRFKN